MFVATKYRAGAHKDAVRGMQAALDDPLGINPHADRPIGEGRRRAVSVVARHEQQS
jgi:hypothetical protein